MERQEALALLKEHVKTANLVKHSLASEAIMRALARRLGEDEERWGLAGLLHDLDFDATSETPEQHGLKAVEILREKGLDEEMLGAIKAHNAEALGLERRTRFEHALAAAETLTGLIVATALVQPDKKVASVKPKSVIKRMKKKDFARNVNRQIIMECEEIGLPLPEFVSVGLEGMRSISDELGL